MSARALILTGTVGVGKTTTAEAIGGLLVTAGLPHAVIDLDWLRRYWPNPSADPFGSVHELRNLAAVAGTYLDAGAARLVLAGVVGDGTDGREYRDALGPRVTDMVVCRLRVSRELGLARITRRHDRHETDRAWHLHRFGELDAALDVAAVEDATVELGDRPPVEVARAVLAAAGW